MDSWVRFWHLLDVGGNGWARQFLVGALTTIEIAVGAFLVGLVIGAGVAVIKLRGRPWVVLVARAYTTVCRAVPELLLIILLYYAGQSALNALFERFGLGRAVEVSGFLAAIVVLGLVQGAYASEVLRGAILAVPKGQVEAGEAFGFRGAKLFVRIVLPATAPHALGGLANLWMVILKDSALISVVGYAELLSIAKQAGGATKLYLHFYLLVGACYYAMTLASNLVIGRIERRLRRWVPAVSN